MKKTFLITCLIWAVSLCASAQNNQNITRIQEVENLVMIYTFKIEEVRKDIGDTLFARSVRINLLRREIVNTIIYPYVDMANKRNKDSVFIQKLGELKLKIVDLIRRENNDSVGQILVLKGMSDLNKQVDSSIIKVGRSMIEQDLLIKKLKDTPLEERNKPVYQEILKKTFEKIIREFQYQRTMIQELTETYQLFMKMGSFGYPFTPGQIEELKTMRENIKRMIQNFNQSKQQKTQGFDLLFPSGSDAEEIRKQKEAVPDLPPLT